jgi:hypothetical protein
MSKSKRREGVGPHVVVSPFFAPLLILVDAVVMVTVIKTIRR